jgi:hypothetical protein
MIAHALADCAGNEPGLPPGSASRAPS